MRLSVSSAAELVEFKRKKLAIRALAGSERVSDFANALGVSRNFVYRQKHKASVVLDEAFSSTAPDDAVLFELPYTKTWLRQVGIIDAYLS